MRVPLGACFCHHKKMWGVQVTTRRYKLHAFLTLLILITLGAIPSACNGNIYPTATSSPRVDTSRPAPSADVDQVIYESYQDDFLGIEFSYPRTWGKIEAQLERCYYSGYKYRYVFERDDVRMGGRSLDCSEPRSPSMTDYPYSAYKVEQVCNYMGKSLCLEEGGIEASVHLTMVFPKAETVCSPSEGAKKGVYGAVTVDLPDHPVIQGIILLAPLLSDGTQAKLSSTDACGSDNATRYDQVIVELIEQIEAGTVDAETQEIVNTLRHLANSVRTIPRKPFELPGLMPSPQPKPQG